MGLRHGIAEPDVLSRVEVLRALAAQEHQRAARDHGLGEIVVEPLLGVGLGGVEGADAAVDHARSLGARSEG